MTVCLFQLRYGVTIDAQPIGKSSIHFPKKGEEVVHHSLVDVWVLEFLDMILV